jgi:transcriptional regulator with XRE-family HTH domain
MDPVRRTRTAPGTGRDEFGGIVRHARQAVGLTLAELGQRTGYSAAQVSRYERGLAPLSDLTVLRRFADVLGISPQIFGLTTRPAVGEPGHLRPISVTYRRSRPGPPTVAGAPGREDGDDPVLRRQLLASLAVTAASAAAGSSFVGSTPPGEAATGDLLAAQIRDAMLGLSAQPTDCSPGRLRADLATALTSFHTCQYSQLAGQLPHLIAGGHAAVAMTDDENTSTLLAEIYTLATRMLIKLDDQQLGWMAADRAKTIAGAAGSPLAAAEAARNLAVLARKAGWHAQAMAIALTAANHPDLRGAGPAHVAERGLLIQSASYSAAKRGDKSGMRELTDEAAAIAARLGGTTLLRNHGGGFSPVTVELHRISAEYSLGEAGAAIAAARRIAPARLPTVERRARYYTDIAQAYGQWGRRSECINALLAAERQAPQDVHTRPAVRALVSGLLVSGRTTSELRGLAARCGLR